MNICLLPSVTAEMTCIDSQFSSESTFHSNLEKSTVSGYLLVKSTIIHISFQRNDTEQLLGYACEREQGRFCKDIARHHTSSQELAMKQR